MDYLITSRKRKHSNILLENKRVSINIEEYYDRD